MSEIGTTYQLEIEVLTPLHVGSGTKLLEGFDFTRHNGRTYRLDVDRLLTDRWPDDERQQDLLLGRPPADLLEKTDYTADSPFFIYSLAGEPALREIIEQIRDVQGRAYLPGSSLKGALRTALLRFVTGDKPGTIGRGDIGPGGGPREAVKAAKAIETQWLGGDPNRDLLRAVQVADSAPLPGAALRLQRLQMVPQLDVDVEAIERGTRLAASLRIDTWLLKQTTSGLDWTDRARQIVQRLPEAMTMMARRRVVHEFEYHRQHQQGAAATFYGKLGEELASPQWPKNQFVMQVGFATGWRSKSVLGNLPDDAPLLEQIVHDFQMDRGGGKGRGYVRGQAFPKARHLAYVGGQPTLPMGWLKVRMVN